ncbi:hypothetical protein J6590_053182 [Homalodisca vitripennis]|nr:hypothetical protein J6590_053182 [Homalodisca vitripennis]
MVALRGGKEILQWSLVAKGLLNNWMVLPSPVHLINPSPPPITGLRVTRDSQESGSGSRVNQVEVHPSRQPPPNFTPSPPPLLVLP